MQPFQKCYKYHGNAESLEVYSLNMYWLPFFVLECFLLVVVVINFKKNPALSIILWISALSLCIFAVCYCCTQRRTKLIEQDVNMGPGNQEVGLVMHVPPIWPNIQIPPNAHLRDVVPLIGAYPLPINPPKYY